MSGRWRWIGLFVLLLFFVPAVAFGWNTNDEKRIIKGKIYINDILVGGMEIDRARKVIQENFIMFPDEQVQVCYGNQKWQFSFSELGIKADIEGAVREAQQFGKKGPVFQRIEERWIAATKGKKITVPIIIENEKSMSILKPVAVAVEKKALNAKYIYHNQKVEIIPHTNGRQLNMEETINRLLAAAKKASLGSKGMSISLPVEEIHPQVTSEQLKNKSITITNGAYTTYFNTGQTSRSKNIALAVKFLDGTVVPPGATFSFNEAVGPRTKGTGFEEALIIVDKEFVPGLGGGVCQVSSTLYNAVLRAGLKIKERSRHSRVINYVPVGLDAAVSYGFTDFKFINNSDSYVVVCAEVYGGNLEVRILSEKEKEYTIEIKSMIEDTVQPRTETRNDPGIGEGKEYIESPGKKGYVTRVERWWIKNGKVERKEVISRDFYPAEAKVIVKGTRQMPVVQPEQREKGIPPEYSDDQSNSGLETEKKKPAPGNQEEPGVVKENPGNEIQSEDIQTPEA
ncbi:MAG: VanW family protein [Bacillota bacterium]